jgi:primosomal protein DnaI
MKKIEDFYEIDNTKLQQSFITALKDKDFKAFVNTLDIKDETLMKYTSNLEEASVEYHNCKNCKSLSTCKNNMKGYKYTPLKEKDIITFSYEMCPKKEKEEDTLAYQKNLELFDMPKEIKEANFKDIYKDDKSRLPIIKFFKEFMDDYKKKDKPKGLYLNGSFGSGKTYLIAALFNEMAKKGIRGALIYYPEFLRSLKASFNSDYNDKFEYIKKVPLLLLDDIGAENTSAWSRDEVLGPILQYRMEEHLPTFFTSNLTLQELEKSLSITTGGVDKVKARRIVERIKQLTTNMELISKNRRN